jgi:hypothetical protein
VLNISGNCSKLLHTDNHLAISSGEEAVENGPKVALKVYGDGPVNHMKVLGSFLSLKTYNF